MPRTHARARLLGVGVLTVASATLAGTVLAFTAQAAPLPVPEDTPKKSATVLDWLAVEQSDRRPEYVRVGADWTVHSHLYTNDKGRPGKKIGDASAHCSAVDVTPHGYVALCHRVLRTDDGSISLSDAIDRFGPLPHGGLSAVTGGTGKYVEAEGEAEIVMRGDIARIRVMLDD
ncbi:hypothetical protein [Streptomyces sp. NPDC058335]|uniref:hypothetical protein n=1 Tax=Streptomyces sp. NPDC058335 TaxID=3346451 RepID=UPI00364943C8